MKRLTTIAIVATIMLGAFATNAPAQVSMQLPGGHIEIGPPGVHVQTPFFRGYFPAPPVRPPFPFPFGRRRIIMTPPTIITPAPESPSVVTPGPNVPGWPNYEAPAPTPIPEPAPKKKESAKKTRPLTIEEFAKSFQPKEGHYQVVLLNPINGAATNVRFSLPEGTPKVRLGKNSVEFRYGLRRYVRIEFDQEGAIVISR